MDVLVADSGARALGLKLRLRRGSVPGRVPEHAIAYNGQV